MRNTPKVTGYPDAKHSPVLEKPDNKNRLQAKPDTNKSLPKNLNETMFQANMLWNILDTMEDMIFLVSRNSTVTYVNSAARHLFKEDITGRSFNSISPHIECISFRTVKNALKPGNSVYQLTDLQIRTGNVIRHVDLMAQYFSGSPDSYIIILRDKDAQTTSEKSLLQKIVNTQEKERNRIALNLHDSLGHKISASKFFIYTAIGNSDTASRESLLLKANSILHAAVHEIRQICFDLMPRSLEEEGLEGALKDLINNLQADKSITFKLEVELKGYKIPQAIELDLFRIIQELITNTIKHGHAGEISITLSAHANAAKLIYQDNGKGFKVTRHYKGNGLRNIELRVASNNGELSISSIPHKKTHFTITFPFNC
jgi:signal transduction histidine kinase